MCETGLQKGSKSSANLESTRKLKEARMKPASGKLTKVDKEYVGIPEFLRFAHSSKKGEESKRTTVERGSLTLQVNS